MDNEDCCDELRKEMFEGGVNHDSLPFLTANLEQVNKRIENINSRLIILEIDRKSEQHKIKWALIIIIIMLASNIIYRNFVDIEYIRAFLHL